jgi:protease I
MNNNVSENTELKGKKIAILATNGFEQDELLQPKKALEDAGATVDVVSPESGEIMGWKGKNWGEKINVDVQLGKADAASYDGIVLPGGVINPDQLRMNKDAVAFVKTFVDGEKPIAAICHGPWTLIETGLLKKGRKMTSWPSLKSDLQNAGAVWVDEEVVVDQGLVTSRKPDDLPAFNKKMIAEFKMSKNTH